MSKNPKAGRAIRKLRRSKSAGDALRILRSLDSKTLDQVNKAKGL